MIWSSVVALCALHDPEQLLRRAHNSMEESLGFVTSFANSQRFIHVHQDIVAIREEMETLTHRLQLAISNNES